MKTKVLLNRRMLVATLMTMALFAAIPAQAQMTLAAAYNVARLKNDGGNMHGLAITSDRVVWSEYFMVSGALSHTMGENKSMTYIGFGPGVRFDTGKIQVFGYVLNGILRVKVDYDYNTPDLGFDISDLGFDIPGAPTSASNTNYDEIRIGGGVDIPFSDRGFAHVGVAYDEATHVTAGASFRF